MVVKNYRVGAQPEFETSTSKFHESFWRRWRHADILDNDII